MLQEEMRENKVEVYHSGSVLVVQFRTKLNSLRKVVVNASWLCLSSDIYVNQSEASKESHSMLAFSILYIGGPHEMILFDEYSRSS